MAGKQVSSRNAAKLVLSWCVEAGIPVVSPLYRDASGMTIALGRVPLLVRYIVDNVRLSRTDRLSLVAWLAGLEKQSRLFEGDRWSTAGGYARVVEGEIEWIAGLEEPLRTIEAGKLLKRLEDAKTVAEVGKRTLAAKRWATVKGSVERLAEMARGGYRPQSQAQSQPSSGQTRLSKSTGTGRLGSGSGSGSGSGKVTGSSRDRSAAST